jgi:2-polyprenyl-3-methyl-5-hydroxy-6-metoxy-1,4-benzoquinol methylase
MGWSRILRCAECGLVRAGHVPTLDEKRAIETQGYTDEHYFPEVRDLFANCHRDFVEDPVIRAMRRHLAEIESVVGRPGALLDIGAGTGIFMHLARERGWTPEGVDICALTAEKAAEEFAVKITVGAFEEQHFDGRRFDAVTMLDVLEHVHDPLATLRRAREVLRPGGAVYVAVPNQRSLLTVLVDAYARAGGPGAHGLLGRLYVPPHLHYFTPATLRRALAASGLRLHSLRQRRTYLGRYRMGLAMRIPLEAVLAAGACLGMSARLEAIAIR